MALWKDPAPPRKEPVPPAPAATPKLDAAPRPESTPSYDMPRRATVPDIKESLIAADLNIEGKIEGAGHVRIAGRFKGDINVQGHLTIEAGAKVTGGVRANTVIIAGELEGNIDAASRVELLETGVLNGDLKSGSLTVAAGSRMRGQVEFGWEEKTTRVTSMKMEGGTAA